METTLNKERAFAKVDFREHSYQNFDSDGNSYSGPEYDASDKEFFKKIEAAKSASELSKLSNEWGRDNLYAETKEKLNELLKSEWGVGLFLNGADKEPVKYLNPEGIFATSVEVSGSLQELERFGTKIAILIFRGERRTSRL